MTFLDTSVLVAAALTRHARHAESAERLRQANKSNTACALHSIAETYSVLSGMPKPHRLPPSAALVIVQQLRTRLRVVSLTEAEYAATVEDIAAQGLIGAIVYDALLLACAAKCQATRILTWNPRHCRLVAPKLADRISTP